jgi:hypothetical protein
MVKDVTGWWECVERYMQEVKGLWVLSLNSWRIATERVC